jgi:2-keto-4-pentenoate hydratase/2-oxohepta-3-ene-1,7-dioic acid hydratase in catechol pathway
MKIVSFGADRSEQPGVLIDDRHIVPLAGILAAAGLPPTLDTNAILAFLPFLQPIIEEALTKNPKVIDLASTRLGPPVPRPEKIIVAGGNYRSHVDEAAGMANAPIPSEAILIFKPSNTVIGPRDRLIRPLQSQKFDYETEIVVVVGRGGRNITRERAYEHIAGYMIGNDATARDMAFKDMHLNPIFAQMTRAKGIRTGAPIGPWLVTKDEIPDPHNLHLQCWINDELRQDGWSSEMIVDIPGLIEDFSKVLDLSPGDIIFTGTTRGCGAFQVPPQFLFGGDVVRMQISGLGVMETPVVDEVPS